MDVLRKSRLMQLNRPSTRGGSQDCSDFCNFMFAAAMFILMAALPQARLAASDETSADVVVYGGTSAGVAAAVQVVRQRLRGGKGPRQKA